MTLDWTDNLLRAGTSSKCMACGIKASAFDGPGGIRHAEVEGCDLYLCVQCLRGLAVVMRDAGAFVHALETVCPDCRGQGTAPGSLYQASGGRWITQPCATCKGKRMVVLEAAAPLETLAAVVPSVPSDPVPEYGPEGPS